MKFLLISVKYIGDNKKEYAKIPSLTSSGLLEMGVSITLFDSINTCPCPDVLTLWFRSRENNPFYCNIKCMPNGTPSIDSGKIIIRRKI